MMFNNFHNNLSAAGADFPEEAQIYHAGQLALTDGLLLVLRVPRSQFEEKEVEYQYQSYTKSPAFPRLALLARTCSIHDDNLGGRFKFWRPLNGISENNWRQLMSETGFSHRAS